MVDGYFSNVIENRIFDGILFLMEHLSCFNEPLFRHQKERVFCVPSAHMRCVPGLTQFEEENDYFTIAKDYQVIQQRSKQKIGVRSVFLILICVLNNFFRALKA